MKYSNNEINKFIQEYHLEYIRTNGTEYNKSLIYESGWILMDNRRIRLSEFLNYLNNLKSRPSFEETIILNKQNRIVEIDTQVEKYNNIIRLLTIEKEKLLKELDIK